MLNFLLFLPDTEGDGVFGGAGGVPGGKTHDCVVVPSDSAPTVSHLTVVHIQPPANHQNHHARGPTNLRFQ